MLKGDWREMAKSGGSVLASALLAIGGAVAKNPPKRGASHNVTFLLVKLTVAICAPVAISLFAILVGYRRRAASRPCGPLSGGFLHPPYRKSPKLANLARLCPKEMH